MNILVHTWVFSKYKGSEFAVAYNYVKEMSKHHHLYVLVESNALEWNDLSEFNGGGEDNCIDNVEFITCPYENKLLLWLCYHVSWWFKYFLYRGWEKGIYKFLKKSDLLQKIDIIHYAAPVGYREPGYLWKFDKPYIWGPFGGMQRVSKYFLKFYPKKERYLTQLKNILNFLQFHFPNRIARAMKSSEIVIAYTKTQQEMVNKRLYTKRCYYLPENGIDYSKLQSIDERELENKYTKKILNIVWIGTNCSRKMPKMLLDALELVNSEDYTCTFVGAGCGRLNVPNKISTRVKTVDNIPRAQVLELYRSAHICCITSAMEANTTVIFEALENAVPVVTVDHCGMADIVKDEITGEKVPVENYNSMVRNFALKLEQLLADHDKLLGYAKNIKNESYEYSQEYRMDFFEERYKEAVRIYARNRQNTHT